MIKRISLILMVLIAIVALSTGCASKSSAATNRPHSHSCSIDGTYLSASAQGPSFIVTVTKDYIVVYMNLNERRGLYWKGTRPKHVKGSFDSRGDQTAMAYSVFGSKDSAKRFYVDGRSVKFQFSASSSTMIEAVR